MYKKTLLVLVAAATCALAMPSIASATAIPNLPADVDQAYIADGDGNPESGTFTLQGTLTVNRSTGLTWGCSYDTTVDFSDDGTTAVTAFSATGCSTNVPGCTLTTSATGLSWGDRFGYDTTSGLFRDYINVATDATLGSGCPFSGTFAQSGLLSPTIAISGGVLTATFGPGSGFVTGPLGIETYSGTLTSTSGIGPDTGLVA